MWDFSDEIEFPTKRLRKIRRLMEDMDELLGDDTDAFSEDFRDELRNELQEREDN